MTLKEIKKAVSEGRRVYCGNKGYEVMDGGKAGLLINCTANGYAIGLTHADGVTMNGKPSEFFTEEPKEGLIDIVRGMNDHAAKKEQELAEEKTYCEACEDCGRKEGEKCLNYSDTDCGLWLVNHPKAAPAAKHTPGPWTDKNRAYDGMITGIDSEDDDDIVIAKCYDDTEGPNNISTAEMKANARLIAAAPELLAALERVLECHRLKISLDTNAGAVEQARAAIAKAKGDK